MKKAFRILVAVTALAAAWLLYFALSPMSLPKTPYEFTVSSGSGLKAVARQLTADGVFAEPESLWIVARILGKGRSIQAGTYRLDGPTTPLELIDKMERGDVVLEEVRFVEGTTLRQWLAQLAAQPRVKQTLAGKSEMDLRPLLGELEPLEGWFFPDTYRFSPGTTDLDILKRAHAAMKRRLAEAWEARDPGIALQTPYEALTMASIVEKETGQGAERPLIASVFENRIRRGMRLQTDPTVIYGLGERYDGSIHKRDLLEDTPWNTYTRDGLPPTPIAMPGAASIRAVLHPATSQYLYFVARGDGTHEFSASLEDHNRAVAKYQLGK
ncbi:MAG TPA: endolytic transglycosylase MltG [Usitatibacter sp.]